MKKESVKKKETADRKTAVSKEERQKESLFCYIKEKGFPYDTDKAKETEALYNRIEQYASKEDLRNVLQILPVVRALLLPPSYICITYKKDSDKREAYFRHALLVGEMLIDLAAPVSGEEEDQMICAALGHVLIELVVFENNGEELVSEYLINPRILSIIRLITRNDPLTEWEQKMFYERIRKNKLALLVRLADRGRLVETLYTLSLWDAKDYVRETRNYFFPMCIYAKEAYPELIPIINLLMEKMRSLIDVTDILSTRYQEREIGLTEEILYLTEDNSRIRSIIAKLGKSDLIPNES